MLIIFKIIESVVTIMTELQHQAANTHWLRANSETYFPIFQPEDIHKIYLNFNESLPIYAYKRYAYKKRVYEHNFSKFSAFFTLSRD